MKNSRLWLVPLCFYVICCVLILIGAVISPELKATVKPALIAFLCITTLAWLLPRLNPENGSSAMPAVALLTAAQLFGCAGDIFLIPDGFVYFASGIGCFLIGHIFYISIFGGRSFKGLKAWHWIVGLTGALAATAALAMIIGVNGSLLIPMAVYGFVLVMLIFSTLCGLLRFGGCTWWLLFTGALLFTFSDALIAINTFKGLGHLMRGVGVMSTYIAAQSLLAIGACRLITGRK